MTVEPFSPDKHMHILCAWLTDRGTYVPSREEMPAYGFVAYDDSVPIAMGFLRCMEGGYAQIDGLATDPRASGEQRHLAQDAVVVQLINKAKHFGIKSLTAYSVHKGALKRALTHGFVHLPHTVIALDLTLESNK